MIYNRNYSLELQVKIQSIQLNRAFGFLLGNTQTNAIQLNFNHFTIELMRFHLLADTLLLHLNRFIFNFSSDRVNFIRQRRSSLITTLINFHCLAVEIFRLFR